MKLAGWTLVGLLATAAHARDELTVPLMIASSPHAFAGRTVSVLCSVTRLDLGTYACPAADQIGRHLANITIKLEEMSEADQRYIVSRCSAKSAVQPCDLVIVGTVEVSENGALSLSRPWLKLF
ncbi:hypothetical protein [Microvirga sp. Mcv34]|uniref:hypothetical protein n=1 Tax=Microvirga sp. Mcv34 TaxID=2926016 RepID=UPI0021C8DECA|nr:hypothetical protein [Microvirga sp. Mcv34]